MWLTEITVKQHLKEMHQDAEMRRLAVELSQTQNPRHWFAHLFAFLRRRSHQAEVIELAAFQPSCEEVQTLMRRAS
jgi:hypothetical protein